MTMSPEEIMNVLSETIKSIKNSDSVAMEQNRPLLLSAAKDSEEFTEIDLVSVCHKVLGHLHRCLNFPIADVERHYELAAQHCKDESELPSILLRHADALDHHGKVLRKEVEDERHRFEHSWADDYVFQVRDDAGRQDALYKVFNAMDAAVKTFKKASEMRLRADELQKFADERNRKLDEAQANSEKKTDANTADADQISYKSPAQIVAELDDVAIGQRAAKRGLANSAAQHLKRMLMSDDERSRTEKSNVLFAGPTGCGKTLLVRALAKIINVPFHSTSATKLTASGYVGPDVQSILSELLNACNFDVERAEKAIVFIDEIDKKAVNRGAVEVDIGGGKIQEELLTIIEGTKVRVPKDGNAKSLGSFIEIDTTNILFIVAGAFTGLQGIVNRRLAVNTTSIGFSTRPTQKELPARNASDIDGVKFATAADFIDFGMTPEFMGRLPKRLFIERLDVEQLERILLEPRKALLPEKRSLLAGTTDLRFTKGAVRAIAEEAHKIGTNGRALREIVEEVLDPIVFDERPTALVTAEMVKNRRLEMAHLNAADKDAGLKYPDFVVEE